MEFYGPKIKYLRRGGERFNYEPTKHLYVAGEQFQDPNRGIFEEFLK